MNSLTSEKHFDIAVVGAGPAGVTAAARAIELGASTAVISSGEYGGMAANDGPVPVRTLAHTARLIRDSKQLSRYGVVVSEPQLDYPTVLARVGEVVETVSNSSYLQDLISTEAIQVFDNAGTASFRDANTITTKAGLRVTADKFIIATGGISKKLPIPGFELTSTHSDAWTLSEIPESIVVIGGGATGLQVASIFNAFGSTIRLFEAGPRILAAEDGDTAAAVADAFRRKGIQVRENFGSIASFEKTAAGIRMNFIDENNRQDSVDASLVVVAAGWGADTEGLALPAACVELTARGFIAVDEHLQTSMPNIYAAGDVTGRIMLASEAIRDGFVAANNAVQGPKTYVGHHLAAAGSFTDPEYASIGLTEEKARAIHQIDCVTVNFSENIRAVIDGQTTGFCKLVIESSTHEILGCHVVGEHAIEIIQIASTAFAAGLRKVDELARISVSFPTYAQILIHAAVRASALYNLDIGWRAGADN
ncbi:NAD(P)/FAD-dependent oxidoreductase [Mycobacteroides immunogenum]|uniref:dihydrolipoyl dehydrogenase family protein n=1 Tax=Mycobacteroides immunogenum TaxID=83262 RepID=UPI0025B74C39|nr:NAD(P)/FAD-dependent oxidoreductase [Mycobacteroides immunogenum]WJR36131.1 NAD(P)/FAD-dependent oxidoreductase [Mycobacteroides immunogenum]